MFSGTLLWNVLYVCVLTVLKIQSVIRVQFHKSLLIFQLICQSNYTPPLRAPEVPCWLAGIAYGSILITMFVSQWQSQNCVQTQDSVWAQTLYAQLEDQMEPFAKFDKNCIGLELRTVPFINILIFSDHSRMTHFGNIAVVEITCWDSQFTFFYFSFLEEDALDFPEISHKQLREPWIEWRNKVGDRECRYFFCFSYCRISGQQRCNNNYITLLTELTGENSHS